MSKAKDYFSNIGSGHKTAIQRPSSPWIDRGLRRLVEKANREGDCIINVGNGYYRPIPFDLIDEAECKEYFASELSRARKILSKRLSMKITFERWKDDAAYACHTRKA